jgi:hypothetical protein
MKAGGLALYTYYQDVHRGLEAVKLSSLAALGPAAVPEACNLEFGLRKKLATRSWVQKERKRSKSIEIY